jgi:hypothetical protein
VATLRQLVAERNEYVMGAFELYQVRDETLASCPAPFKSAGLARVLAITPASPDGVLPCMLVGPFPFHQSDGDEAELVDTLLRILKVEAFRKGGLVFSGTPSARSTPGPPDADGDADEEADADAEAGADEEEDDDPDTSALTNPWMVRGCSPHLP